jgi:nucleoid DNA-binding protein
MKLLDRMGNLGVREKVSRSGTKPEACPQTRMGAEKVFTFSGQQTKQRQVVS